MTLTHDQEDEFLRLVELFDAAYDERGTEGVLGLLDEKIQLNDKETRLLKKEKRHTKK